MFASKKRLIISTILIVLIVSAIVVFVPSWKIDKIVDETIKQLDEKYKDEFTMTWSDLEQQPLATSFLATVQSNQTNIVYDVIVVEDKATIDYEAENHQMDINHTIEQRLPGTYALSKVEGEQLTVRLLVTEAITGSTLAEMASTVKQSYALQTVHVELIELNVADYEAATAHITKYYQRSTVPTDAFELYEHQVTLFKY